MSRRLLITGLHGTLAPVVAELATRQGYDVIAWPRHVVPPDDLHEGGLFLSRMDLCGIVHLAYGSENWAGLLSRFAGENGIPVVFSSTAMVFSNRRNGPYTIDDVTDSNESYGQYKIRCEQAVRAANSKSCVLRLGWQINENVGLTAIWFRPANDNFKGWNDAAGRTREANYLDNLDMFFLGLPLEFDGVSATPWVMYGLIGKNAIDGYHGVHRDDGRNYEPNNWTGTNGTLNHSLYSLYPGFNLQGTKWLGDTRKGYGSSFWVGLPLKLTLWDPLRIEFDFNYGYVEGMGRYDVMVRNNPGDIRRASSERKGWLAKALVEYKFDWGIPGIFGWYGSGDDGSLGNGSERMPALAPATCFTTFMGDMEYWDWAPTGTLADRSISYAGTWGLGLQIRDMSFIDDLKHTFRVAWWGGTNSPSMVKYMDSAHAWYSTAHDNHFEGPYMTTNDGLLEFNLVNVYKMYENFNINFELGYVCNFMDDDTWKRSYNNWGSYTKQDIWKAQLIFTYQF